MFDPLLPTSRQRNRSHLIQSFPSEERASCESGLLENHDYFDIRGIEIEEAIEVIDAEAKLLARIEVIPAEKQEDELNQIEDELYDDFDCLVSFDLGVGGLVTALSAVGCVPISSCNGGGLGDHHRIPHPWVIFHASETSLTFLLEAAEQTDTGLINNTDGMLQAFSDDSRKFNRMARYLVDHCQS